SGCLEMSIVGCPGGGRASATAAPPICMPRARVLLRRSEQAFPCRNRIVGVSSWREPRYMIDFGRHISWIAHDIRGSLIGGAMQQFSRLLLDVWREAGRHIEIDVFTDTVTGLLSKQAPLGQVVVRRFEREPGGVVTVAAAPLRAGGRLSEDRRTLSAGELRSVLRWGRGDQILGRGRRVTGVLKQILPEGLDEDVLAAPLAHQSE